MKKILGLLLTGIVIYFAGCIKKDFDKPPVGTLPVGNVYTIEDVRQMYADSGGIQINYDASIYGIITADESSGNLYKNVYFQDFTDAVNLHLNASGGFRTGDSVRIYLKGIVLNEYGGVFQLDNVSADSNQVIIANQKYLEPKVVSIPELQSGDFESQLIKLENVQFTSLDTGSTWAIPDGYGERILEDCDGESVMVRTSSYANFGDLIVPNGNGSIIAIVGSFNGTIQLYVRTITEVDMKSERCDGGGGTDPIDPVSKVEEYFDDVQEYEDIDLPGWRNIRVTGNRLWQGKFFQSEKYAQSTGYNSGLDVMETWLITPPVINTAADKILSFKSAMSFWAHQGGNKPLTVFASTDYDGTNFDTANWTELSITVADETSGDNNWVPSGDYPLTAFTGNVAIAFRYTGSDTESTSSRIDDVLITDDGGGGGGDPIPPVNEVNEQFNDAENYTNIDIEGWSNFVVDGTRYWQGKTFDADKYAQATGYNSGLDVMETWLITPPVVNTSGDKKLSFKNAMAYWEHSGQPLTVLASTDYDGTNFETANWTALSPNLASSSNDNYAWVESGEISLDGFVGNVAIAFKYVGSDTESTSIQIDDVLVSGGGGGNDGVTSIDEDFESLNDYDEVNLPGWVNVMTEGARTWQAKEYDSNIYAQATSYNSGENNTTYLITPKMDLAAMTNPVFEFDNAQAYWAHDGLSVLISTDFNGTDVGSATWEVIDCNLAGSSTPDHEWVNSGIIDLSGYSSPAYIAFKYQGSDPDHTTSYRIDNVKLYEE